MRRFKLVGAGLALLAVVGGGSAALAQAQPSSQQDPGIGNVGRYELFEGSAGAEGDALGMFLLDTMSGRTWLLTKGANDKPVWERIELRRFTVPAEGQNGRPNPVTK